MYCCPLSLLPLVITGLFPRPVSLSLFCVQVHLCCCLWISPGWCHICLCLTSLTVTLSGPSTLLRMGSSHSPCGQAVFHCMCTPHVLSFHRWMLGLLPCLKPSVTDATHGHRVLSLGVSLWRWLVPLPCLRLLWLLV